MYRKRNQSFILNISREINISIFHNFAFYTDWQTDVQNIYGKDTHIWEECSQKKISYLSKFGMGKSFLPFVGWLIDWHTKNLKNRFSYMRGSTQKKNIYLSQFWVKKIAFSYFYISAFCSLTDRQMDEIFVRGMCTDLYLN